MTKISIIAAMDKNRGIGKNNQLPWSIPEDLARFKKLTKGHPVIMGRKTFESIIKYLKKPLPGRTNIIITRQKDYQYSDCIVVDSLDYAIKKAVEINNVEIFIIGGASIYQQAIGLADRLYLTIIDKVYDCDAFFPDYSGFRKIINQEKRYEKDFSCIWIILEKLN